MPAALDVCFRHRETLTIDAVISALDGTPANIASLSGDEIQWGISKAKDGPPLATCEIGSGITITDGPNGHIRIQLAPDAQDALARGTYQHECKAVTAEGTSIQFAGQAIIDRSIFAGDAE